MGLRRFVLAWLSATFVLVGTTGPTLAKKPDPGTSEEPPLTPQQQAASDRKSAEAERYVASVDASADGLAPLCVVLSAPVDAATAESGSDPSTLEAHGQSSDPLVASPELTDPMLEPLACYVPQGFLAVEARDQIFGHYCGPAVGQVIANYSWAMPAGANKYTQRQIAGWMGTDVYGQTNADWMQAGLDVATARSPRLPRNWDWVVTMLRDTDGDGWSGDQLDAFVRSNISNSRMPLAIPVKPHDPNAPNGAHLASWPNPVRSPGHWVAIYGWVGIHDGSDRARMYYTDSSRDEGGATGKFWTSTWYFTIMILNHTQRLVW